MQNKFNIAAFFIIAVVYSLGILTLRRDAVVDYNEHTEKPSMEYKRDFIIAQRIDGRTCRILTENGQSVDKCCKKWNPESDCVYN